MKLDVRTSGALHVRILLVRARLACLLTAVVVTMACTAVILTEQCVSTGPSACADSNVLLFLCV